MDAVILPEVINDAEDSNAEVMQVETEMITVPVSIDDVVRTKSVPSIGGTEYTQFSLAANAAAVKVLNGDPQRRQATLLATDQPFNVGSSQAQAGNTSTAVEWPKSIPLVIYGVNEVWASAGTADSATTLMVVTEREF
jgi:hypothetical protein